MCEIHKALALSIGDDTLCVLSNEKYVFDHIFETAAEILNGTYSPSGPIGYYGVIGGHEIAYNEHKRFIPASTTKLLTALCAIQKRDPETKVTVHACDIADGSGSEYAPGETFCLSDAVKVMLMESSNTLANAIARTCGAPLHSSRCSR